MHWDEIGRWLNDNQGIVAVVIFILTIVVGKMSGLFKLIFRKRSIREPTSNQSHHLKMGGPVIKGSKNVSITQTIVLSSDLKKQVNDMDSKKEEVLRKMKLSPETRQSDWRTDSQDYKQVIALINDDPRDEPTEDKKKKLRSLLYSTIDKNAQLQITIALVSWFDLLKDEDKITDYVEMCDLGISTADVINAKSEKAILLAYKGRFISMQFSFEDMQGVFSVQASNLTGMPFISEKEREQVIERLHKLDRLSQKCFADAQNVAVESKNYEALGYVYMLIGEAAGQRYIHLSRFAPERAKDEKRLSKRALLLAKDIYSKVGDELLVANSLHNLANQLRLFDEKEEAKDLIQKVIPIAEKYNDRQLLRKSRALLKRIESGKIPNYMGGEKSEF